MCMTPLAVVLLILLILLWKLDFIATLLNLKNLKPELPSEFADVFDKEKYEKSQNYTKANSQFHVVSSVLSLFLLLGFWLCGGFVWLNDLVTSWGFGKIVTGLCYLGLLFAGNLIINLPFEIYSTFVLEKRFGFNKTSLATFISDQIKSLILAVVIGGPILALLLWIFGNVSHAWAWAWVVITVVSLLLTYLAPTYIMPLFNKFTPLGDGELKDQINAMAKQCEFPLTELYVIDGSKRSTKANAFFTGFGKNKKIALYDTLIEEQSNEELVGVLAHEIGHFKRKHIVQRMVLSVIQSAVIFYLIGLFTTQNTPISNTIYEAFRFPEGQQPLYVGLALFGILFKPISFLLQLAMNLWSRKHEFEADHYAKVHQGTPNHLISALKKLSAQNLSNLTPHPLLVFLEYSHPPVLQRIEALKSDKTF